MKHAAKCEAPGNGRRATAGYPPPLRGNETTAARLMRIAHLRAACAPMPLARPIQRATSRPIA